MTQNKHKLVSTEYFTFISGPCAIESEKMAMTTAEFLKNVSEKLNINLYYKFSNKIPKDLDWHSIYDNKEFTPTFAKKIFKQVENLY